MDSGNIVSYSFYTSIDVTFLKDVPFFASHDYSPASVSQETTSISDQGELPCPIQIFDLSSPIVSLPPVITYSLEFRNCRRSQAHALPLIISLNPGPTTLAPVRRSSRVSRPVNRYGHSCFTHHPISQYISCKWVYTVKHLLDGSIDRYKARPVAKGFTQILGKDFSATFAHVAKLTTVHLLILLAALILGHFINLT